MDFSHCWRISAACHGFIGLVAGALAAHAIADGTHAALATRASEYQLIHALLLLWLCDKAGNAARASRWFISAGVAFFCGALYLKALAGLDGATRAAPFGGMCLMAGWLALAGIRESRKA